MGMRSLEEEQKKLLGEEETPVEDLPEIDEDEVEDDDDEADSGDEDEDEDDDE